MSDLWALGSLRELTALRKRGSFGGLRTSSRGFSSVLETCWSAGQRKKERKKKKKKKKKFHKSRNLKCNSVHLALAFKL